ncbi:leucine-rich repeat domain-containing protein [Nonomuraea turkmeniaca]|uniref:Leucine-rich repeat domain-containing protein n=1 Tax=Nonomuraea turkmeniaca TaxID=103838 RepID=A0A5S4FTF2_9ACTN|nr:STM4015 family protein [Nonomuraea turkmeniaca]TMR13056.1 leucine-rich repeat domain-containing protein [Nonomuraea turkmeniaca]
MTPLGPTPVIDHTEQPSHHESYHEEYAGLPVAHAPWLDEDGWGPQPEAGAVAWRLTGNEFDDDAPDEIEETLDWFFDHVDTTQVTALVIGQWQECYEHSSGMVVSRLAAESARLPALRAIFLGAITPEESEISWITQADITPLLEAFPKLERLEVRGGSELSLRPVRHDTLRMLRIETGGLGAGVVRAVAASDLPALELLELWLGVDRYGGDATIGDLVPILSGERLPALRHLRLQNAEFQDEIAAAVAAAPIVARLESLSLSMGALTDVGVEALLSGQPLTHLRRLDLDHNFLSSAMMERMAKALPTVDVVLTGNDRVDGAWRFVAVSE